jgi:NTE family protein
MNLDSLVISGGGYYGLAGVGFMYELFKYNSQIFDNIKVMSGCSIGSVIIVFLALGYKPIDIILFVATKFKMPKMNEISIDRLQKKHGLFNIEDVMSYLYMAMEDKFFDRNITFLELSDFCGKELVINCFNLTDLTDVVFSTRLNPNMKIVDAVRYSIAIPLVFSKQLCDGKVYVDGGMHNNVPFEYICSPYTNKKRLYNVPNGYKDCICIEYDNSNNIEKTDSNESIVKYIMDIASKLYEMAKLKKVYIDNIETVSIKCEGNMINTMSMETSEIMNMFDYGCKFFNDNYNKCNKSD